MIGKSLAHYEILSLLGRGGMGEVYRARDTRLKREIALKILPADVGADHGRLLRFQREAESLARVNNPHVVHIYSVEEDAGVNFLTMELIEGRSLDELIIPGGMRLAQVFGIGIAVADALAAAHESGTVHRDLKPANIIVGADDEVKVVDFGLAAWTPPTDRTAESVTRLTPLTADHAILGTIPYMSPEQLRGSTLDHRSDLFSLGIVLFELATGHRPFAGDSAVEISSSILDREPAFLTAVRPDLPRHLGRIVAHCLEKEPAERYHSAIDVRNELRSLRREVTSGGFKDSGPYAPAASAPGPDFPSGGTARRDSRRKLGGMLLLAAVLVVAFLFWRNQGSTPEPGALVVAPNSIAVLPFANMSGDESQEYFSDGLAEELLNLLARNPRLRVAARTSSFSFKGQNLAVTEIARRLGVDHILEGSVRKDLDRIRVTTQLVRAEDGFNLWSKTYDRKFEDIFAIQNDIATDVVVQLKVTLLGESPVPVERDPQAYTLYLQGRYLARKRSAAGFEQAVKLWQQALDIEPEYVEVLVGLATVYANQASYGLLPLDEGFALARESAEKALAADPDCAMAHGNLGWIARAYDEDLAAAAKHYEQALALDPANDTILANATSLVLSLGREDEAIALGEHIIARDPVDPSGHANLGVACLGAGRWDDAALRFQTALDLSPDGLSLRYLLGLARLMGGHPEEALETFAAEPDDEYRVKGSALALHDLGREEEYREKLEELKEGWGGEWPSEVAHVYAWAGEADSAFAWLDKSVAQNESGLSDQFQQPFFLPVQTDPRWKRFREFTGTTDEQLAAIEFHLTLPD